MKNKFGKIYWQSFFVLTGLLISWNMYSQTQRAAPDLNQNIPWSNWWYDNSVLDVENQFNVGRRGEESQKNLPSGSLGNLVLPSDFLSRPFDEQAFILINLERAARAGVNYPGHGTVSGLLLEGVAPGLSQVAQGHADDMQENDFFSHTSSNNTSWSARIESYTGSYDEGKSENIAWNSISSQGGFILGIPLAIYGFIYDDACCGWGHRQLCLRQSGNNNYGDPNKLGIVGFGRSTGSTGDYFVMDYFDPRSNFPHSLLDYGSGMDDDLLVTGIVNNETFEAAVSITASADVVTPGEVIFVAGEEIDLIAGFEVVSGAEFIAMTDGSSSGLQALPSTSNLLHFDPKFQPVFQVKKSHTD